MLSFSTCRLVVLVSAACNAITSADETQPQVELGLAGKYAILANTGISTVPTSAITGDIAVSPIDDTAMTGFSFFIDPSTQIPTSTQLASVHHAYAANYGGSVATDLTTAVGDMVTAYNYAEGRTNDDATRTNLGEGILGGVYGGPDAPLTPGVYTFGSDVNLVSDVHLSGDGVYIIQITGNLKQSANYAVILDNESEDGVSIAPAKSKNIFWQVGGYVWVGAGAHMEGIILAKTKADFLTGSSLNGRILTQTACNLQSATITEPPAPAPTPTPAPTA
eukprot:CAMPEP_0201882554 /NCGR_PEP_ID=MMETSP0902-20130614/14275_1 /ASSEMBLY_ACC=CAM_ASM_000551 /TAXON_ID=420261 /ORGANISM="Thalassiosira antarctica, Strain CCMP982" /LENGTH=277 /DNA_ID=CAMNT_0048411123 /DNA_START=52 /DNA_END=885 /DNA_ORIENTATION=+